MQVQREVRDGRLVLTPDGSLMVGGSAEEFETLLQNVLDEGHKHLIVCLTQVSHIDSGGVRALVRGFQTAQRLGGSLVLASVDRHVHHILEIMRLDVVLHCFESVDTAIAGSPAST
jgi:anti-anti-sigma factor